MENQVQQIVKPTCSCCGVVDNKEQNPYRKWKTYKTSTNPKLTITGYSRAADKTFLHVPELKLGLDAGTVNGRQPEVVFLTHTHIDHSKDLAYICQRKGGCTVYCPKEAVSFIDQWIRAEINLNNCGEWRQDAEFYKYKLVGVQGGDVFFMGKNRVTVVDMIHAVPCVGFLVEDQKTKLKAEYVGVPGKDIAALRKNGVEVNDTLYCPLFAYLGDTHVDVFAKNPQIFDYPEIIVECTFFHNEKGIQERANRDGHIHWDSLRPIVLDHPKNRFILIHWSLRYKEQEIYDFFHKLDDYETVSKNIVLFVNDTTGGSQY